MSERGKDDFVSKTGQAMKGNFATDALIENEPDLLSVLLADSKNRPPLYQPGPYWQAKAKNAAKEIKRCGLEEFRGSSNQIGMSFTDSFNVDVRNAYNFGYRRLLRWLARSFPLNKVFDAQIALTKNYALQNIQHVQQILELKERTGELLEKYIMPFSLLGGCVSKVSVQGNEFSVHYLNLLEQHDNIARRLDFRAARTVFEIGGGFGANIHLLLTNYKNIRKVFYLDIPQNLYVGTQYLKAFYGSAVSDYRETRRLESLVFSADDSLEIFCIAPWQIENIESGVDVLMNSHSFVEMPESVVQNYVNRFAELPDARCAAIALSTYDQFDLNTTIHPDRLPNYFSDREFETFQAETLLNSRRRNYYFVSPGKLAVTR